MKIRNKFTGEIATLTLNSDGETLIIMKDDEMIVYGVSFEDLVQDWEEYKYPNYSFIDYDGVIIFAGENEKFKNEMKEIGNYFETREEAEQAVEKLKAWKRLKDKGFKFGGCDIANKTDGDVCGQVYFRANGCIREEILQDLTWIFGGENEN